MELNFQNNLDSCQESVVVKIMLNPGPKEQDWQNERIKSKNPPILYILLLIRILELFRMLLTLTTLAKKVPII